MGMFEIRCPLCKGTIWVDQSTGKVVDHKSGDQQKVDFNDFLKSRGRDPQWGDKMKKAREEEVKRKAEIEEKFRKAKEHPEDLGDGIVPPINWD